VSDSTSLITGVFRREHDGAWHLYSLTDRALSSEVVPATEPEVLVSRHPIPTWLWRHSVGVPHGPEDLRVPSETRGPPGNLDYAGLQVPVSPSGYSHAVGPIHAGVIEPGHFRFSLEGEVIQSLNIRLGFQHRGVKRLLEGQPPLRALPLAECISGDSTVAYALAFSRLYEEAAGLDVPPGVELLRLVLLELERVAIHVGDIGAIAGDVAFYPLLGLCSTDRGVALGALETLTGSRFGRGAVWPGEVRLSRKLTREELQPTARRLLDMWARVEDQAQRALRDSTVRERLQGCGRVTREQVLENGFVGMAARCTGLRRDLRLGEPLYREGPEPMDLEPDASLLQGDAYARFALRVEEARRSVRWLAAVLPRLDVTCGGKGPLRVMERLSWKPGVYAKAVEGWRGPVLVALDLDGEGRVRQSYLRDPSVLNWHALELAVRSELIGDFPLNNKSFNLSYAGVDL
jgi:Ni,Fe-hydrogenase III large subunit